MQATTSPSFAPAPAGSILPTCGALPANPCSGLLMSSQRPPVSEDCPTAQPGSGACFLLPFVLSLILIISLLYCKGLASGSHQFLLLRLAPRALLKLGDERMIGVEIF